MISVLGNMCVDARCAVYGWIQRRTQVSVCVHTAFCPNTPRSSLWKGPGADRPEQRATNIHTTVLKTLLHPKEPGSPENG